MPRSRTALSALARVETHTLANGLSVMLAPSGAMPIVSYHTVFRVGSRNERPGITGISHLFEHMMFNGSERFGPGEFDRLIEEAGGTSNAFTSNDLTVYYDDFASEALEQVVELEHDRMRALALDERMLESERQVVLEERRLRVDNDVVGLLDEELGALVFKAHPYRWPVIGWERDIEAITREECQRYFRTYYAPNNATLVLAGDFEPGSALRLIRSRYERIPAGPPPAPVLDAEPVQRGERHAVVRYPAQVASLMVGFRGPRAREPDTLALDVLQYGLSVGQSSRLSQALVFDQGVASRVSVDWTWRIDPGIFIVHVEGQPGVTPERLEKRVLAELAVVRRDGLSASDVERARNNLTMQLRRELSTQNGRAHLFGSHDAFLGSWRAALQTPSRYARIDGRQVHQVAQRWLEPSRRSVVLLVPEGTS